MSEIILESDDKAASKRSVSGWVSRTGRFFGKNEDQARYDGCTHRPCDCGKVFPKTEYCRPCQQKKQIEKYDAMPFKEWDGETTLCLFEDETYFHSEEDVEDYIEDHDLKDEGIRLVICEPNYPPIVEEDHFDEVLAEDFCLADVASNLLDQKLTELNEVIQNHAPFSWSPGKYRTTVEHKKKELRMSENG